MPELDRRDRKDHRRLHDDPSGGAEQILQAGIDHVVYVEPYPDKASETLLSKHGVSIRQ